MAADVQKIIDIVFRGVDETTSITKSISGGIDDFAGNIGKVSGPLADVANKALATEAAILGVASAFAGYAYTATAKYESGMLDLQKVMSDAEGSVSDYNGEIQRLSTTYGTTASDVLAGITNFKVAGFEMTDSISLMEDATKLMIAGDIEAANATEILVSSLKGFKAPASEASRLVDVMNEVSNKYATNVQELGIGMARLSPIASLMGFSFEETAGILTPVIEVFRSGSESANALKTGLLRLLDDSKPVQNALAAIGVAQKDANGEFRSGRDILYDVGEAFKTANENDKLYLATQLVGVHQAGRMIEVFNGLDKAVEVTTTAMQANGSAMKEVELRLQSIEIALKRAVVAFDSIAVSFGTRMKDEVTDVVNSFTTLEQSIAGAINAGAFDPLIDAVKPTLEEIQQLFLSMAENLPEALEQVDFSGLVDSLGDLKGEVRQAFEALFGDIDLTTPEGLAAAIQKVIDGVEALTRVTIGIIDAWEPFLSMIGAGIEKIVTTDEATQDLIGSILGWSQIIDKVANNIGILTGSINVLGVGMGLLGGSQMVKAVAGLTSLSSIASTAGAALGTLAGAGVAFAGGWEIGTAIREAVPYIDEATQGFFEMTDQLLNWTGTQRSSNETMEETVQRLRDNIEAGKKWREENRDPVEVKTEFEVIAKGKDAEEVKNILLGNTTGVGPSGLPAWAEGLNVPWVVETEVNVDDKSVQEAKKKLNTEIIEWWSEEKGWQTIEVAVDPKVDKAKAEAELDKIPHEKALEIQIQGEIDKELLQIEKQFETINNLARIQADVEIANVEAATERIKSAFESVNVGIQSTGDLIGNMVGLLSGASLSEKYDIERYIDREYEFREQEFALQEKLAQSSMALNRAKEKFYSGEGGAALIQIESSSVYPELDLVLEALVQRAQIKANSLGLATLLGISGDTPEGA